MAARDGVDVLAFRIGQLGFVVDVRRVAGLLRPSSLTPASADMPDLVGYLWWRERAVSVLDVAPRLLGEPKAAPRPNQHVALASGRVLVLHTTDGYVGLWVTAAERVARILPSAYVAEPARGAAATPWSLGLCRINGELYAMLDPRALSDGVAEQAAPLAVDPIAAQPSV